MTEQSDLGTIKGGGIGVLITQDTARFALMVVFFCKGLSCFGHVIVLWWFSQFGVL